MKHINIILGNHNHQPVGNFDFCIENVYERSYKPFLDIFKTHPSLKFVFHYTGCLLEWLEKNHPEHIDELANLVNEKRIEICSGAFYEPILAMISDKDKHEQIKKLNNYIKNRFNVSPRGMWLAERVWEQRLASTIAESNLEYVILDDTQFLPAAVDKNNMFGYYTTDDGNNRLNIFPISQALRYYIPFKEVDMVIDYLRTVATEEGDRLLVLHDDGEKYGEWPGTYQWVYEDKWLVKFFEALERESDWIHLTTYSEYIDKYPPIDRVYIPSASYEEMLTWVLPAKEQNIFHDYSQSIKDNHDLTPYIRGGFWRNYMRKYSESNRMQKHMMYTSKLVHSMSDSNDKDTAKNYLFKSQCNCPYWHGTFGGLYLNHLRHATYKNIISATKIAEESLYGKNYFRTEECDFDFDGINEHIVSSEKEFIVLDRKSASIITWDIKTENDINIVDSLKRREEAYHRDITQSSNTDNSNDDGGHVSIHDMKKTFDEDSMKHLVFDKNEKVIGIDHFLLEDPTTKDFQFLNYQETGSFVDSLYSSKTITSNDKYTIEFTSHGNVYGKSMSIKKEYHVYNNNKVDINITFENTSNEKIESYYAMENNMTLLAADAEDRYYFFNDKSNNINKIEKLSSSGKIESKIFGLRDDGYTNVEIKFTSTCDIKYLYMPIYTISDSVGSLEKLYQGSTIVCLTHLSIPSKSSQTLSISIDVSRENK